MSSKSLPQSTWFYKSQGIKLELKVGYTNTLLGAKDAPQGVGHDPGAVGFSIICKNMISRLDLVKGVEFSSLAQFYHIIDAQDASLWSWS